jgi:hypothetical protein
MRTFRTVFLFGVSVICSAETKDRFRSMEAFQEFYATWRR